MIKGVLRNHIKTIWVLDLHLLVGLLGFLVLLVRSESILCLQHGHLHILGQINGVGEIESFFFLDVSYHLDIWQVIGMNIHQAVGGHWNEHQLVNSVDCSFHYLADNRSLLHQNEVWVALQLDISKHTVKRFVECSILGGSRLDLGQFLINLGVSLVEPIKLKLQDSWSDPKHDVVTD